MALNFQSLLNGESLFGSAPAGGVMGEETRVANKDAMMALASQLLAGSGYSDRRSTFGQQAGLGLQAAAQARAQSLQAQQKRRLIDAQIQALGARQQAQNPFGNINPSDFTAASLAEFQRSGDYGVLKPHAQSNIGYFNPGDYTPASFAKYSQTGNIADLVRYVTPSNPTIHLLNGVPTAVQPSRTGGATRVDPLSTLPTEIDAAAQRKEAEASASTIGTEQAKRDATFDQDLAVIDDEILRTQRLLTEFKSGKYQTGPLAGKLPNLRTSAQDLSREQGKDTLAAISSATFGALSEGERAFLKEIGISENVNEESNINRLQERLTGLQRAKNRLKSRRRLDAFGGSAPVDVGQTTTINGVKVRRVK